MHIPHRFIKSCVSLSAFILATALPAIGQSTYPDTLWVPVTYYDFHWNYRAQWNSGVTIFRGNPDFEYGDYGSGALVMGMVQDTLDSQSKPVLGPTVYYNAGIQYWFRPWVSGKFQRPAYRPDGTLSGWQTTAYDTAFKNIVIPDSLPFILKDSVSGTYVFDSDSNSPYAGMGFFPLDGKGFGTEGATDVSAAPWGHNYAFTMEVQQPFRYKAGLVFDFSGDDDMWVFINKKLVLDMGGVHSREAGNFNLDNEAARLGLQLGRTYVISVFYAERHVTGSNCRITTNIFMPNQLYLETIGNDTLTAGLGRQVLKAILVDENGDPLPDSVADDVTWTIVSPEPGDSILNPGKKGQILTVQATMAWRAITVTAEYMNPVLHIPVRATRQIWVKPDVASHIVIEALTNDTGGIDLNKDNPRIGPIIMLLNEPVGKADAVLRDKYGNFVSLGSGVTWNVADATKALVAPAAGKGWIGEITRPGALNVTMDSTIVTASQTGLTSGSARVHIYYKMPCSTPVADPKGSTYYGTVSVTLTTATTGAEIWYCTDCDSVVPGNTGKLYTGPIVISGAAAVTLKAIATSTQPGYVNSATMVEVYNNGDPTGPGIKEALFYLGSMPGENTGRNDTLIVVFNELVNCADLNSAIQVFNYLSLGTGNPLSSQVQLDKNCTDGFTDTVKIILTPDAGVIPGKDSLQITNAAIRDKYGNPAPSDGNKQMIMWGREYPYVTTTWPNPFVPGESQIDAGITSAVDAWYNANISGDAQGMEPAPRTGLAVSIESIKRLDVKNCSVKIYDALGNVIQPDIKVYGTSNDNQFYFFWDGRNSNNRLVGSGTYLAIISIKELGSEKTDFVKEKLGVKR